MNALSLSLSLFQVDENKYTFLEKDKRTEMLTLS